MIVHKENAVPKFRLPGITHRTGIFGRTGSGKTRLAAWLLSESPFDQQPYIVIDYKLEQLFSQTDRIKEIGLTDKLPKSPGVYIIHPPNDDDDAMEEWLWRLHEHENTGLYIDEGYGINRYSRAARALLTQGRSKHLPVIWISQRPSQIPPFVVSEADFLAVFKLQLPQDVAKVSEIMGRNATFASQTLPEYHSKWYDVAKDASYTLQPVPDDNTILNRLDERLKPNRRML